MVLALDLDLRLLDMGLDLDLKLPGPDLYLLPLMVNPFMVDQCYIQEFRSLVLLRNWPRLCSLCYWWYLTQMRGKLGK